MHSIISKLTSTLPGELDFYGRIAGKYRIFRRSSKLPALIFLRSGIGSANKINIRYIESISNYFKNSIYLKLLRKLEKTPGYYCQIQKPCNPTASLESLQYSSINKDKLPSSPLACNFNIYNIIKAQPINAGLNFFKPSFSVFSKNIPTRYTTESVKTSLNYINPKPIIYSQRNFDRANQSSNPDKVDHPLPSGIQPVDLERHSFGSSPLKIVRHSTNKNVVIKSADTPLLQQATVHALNLRTGAKAYLDKINPQYASYLQRSFDIVNQSSKTGRVAYPLQSRIQPINKKRHSLGSSPQEMVLRPSIERDMVSESVDTPLLRHRSVKNIGYENKFKESWETGKSILRMQSSNKEMRFWKSLPAKMIIGSSTEKDRISKHTDAASLQKNSDLKIMNDENIFKDSRGHGKNIPIPASYPGAGAKIALNPKNPAIISYIQRGVNIYISNTSSKLNRTAHFLLSGVQTSEREKRSSGFPLIKTAIWPLTPSSEYEETGRGSLIHSFNRLNIINSLQYANTIEKRRTSEELKDITGATAYSSKELILKKPVVQKTDIVSEDKEHLHDKTALTKISGNLIEPFKGRSIYEINTIADKVYKIIERKISIEKDRRGLF